MNSVNKYNKDNKNTMSNFPSRIPITNLMAVKSQPVGSRSVCHILEIDNQFVKINWLYIDPNTTVDEFRTEILERYNQIWSDLTIKRVVVKADSLKQSDPTVPTIKISFFTH